MVSIYDPLSPTDQYCYYEAGQWICVEIPGSIVVPPADPAPGEDDPSGEILLPDGTTIDATALTAAFSGVTQIAWQGRPFSCLWGRRSDGLLVSLTYDKDDDVWAFARHPMTNGAVMSLAVIPSATSDQDELWLVVQRTIGEETKHFIERMTPQIIPVDENDKSRFNYLDCSLSYSGAAANHFTGAAHLAGMTVRGWGDGLDIPEIAVDGSGEFDLPEGLEVETLHVGIHTDAVLISLPTAQLATLRQSISKVKVRFVDTLFGKAGRAPDALEELQFRMMSDAMDDTPPLFSGDMELIVGGGFDDHGTYIIVQDTPAPQTILAVFPVYVASGED
jgi:hypothetical protein